MQLNAHDGGTDGWATLHVLKSPFIVGNSPDHVSWECICGATLATGLYSRQILNLLIGCGACSRLLESPRREPGQPIPGRPVYLPPGGTYLLGGELDVIDKPVMMVGHDALIGYARESGRQIPGMYDPALPAVLTGIDSDSFVAMAESLRSLLGDEYQRLADADIRGRASRTRPSSRNRLIELVEFSESTARVLADWNGQGNVNLNGDLLAESVTVLHASCRWRYHPAWPSLRATLASITEAPHTIMLLTMASYLVDANNGIGIHISPSRQQATAADIWIEPDLSQRVDLEVKTPLGLRGPKRPISEPYAIQLLERALKKSSPQRRNTRTSLLAIGGYHMGASYNTMVSTAKAMLALERKWRGLAGIVIVDCTYETTGSDKDTQFSPVARVEIARHRGYQGDLRIESDPMPVSGLPPGIQAT